MGTIGMHGAGILPISRQGGAPFGMFVYRFSLADVVFTPNMAVRAGHAAFDAAFPSLVSDRCR